MRIKPFCIEYNDYNGFLLEVLAIETEKISSSLFGLNFASNFFYIDFLFFNFCLFDEIVDEE